MLFPTACRQWDGVYITGQHIALELYPNAEGTIRVSVIGLPAITGFDGPCRLSSCEPLPQFAPTEIQVHDTRLECFAVDAFAPSLRTGFRLELEPGMAPLLRAWLTKLATVAAASKVIADKFNAQLQAPIYHMLNAITSVVARIVLADWEAEHSVAYEREHSIWSKEQEFMSQFDAEGVKQILCALVAAGAPQIASNIPT